MSQNESFIESTQVKLLTPNKQMNIWRSDQSQHRTNSEALLILGAVLTISATLSSEILHHH